MKKPQKKKASSALPKPRGVWRINPKTRVRKSKTVYSRSEERRKIQRRITDKITWFGEKQRHS